MSQRLITLLLLTIAIIHLLPLSGLAGGERLTALYGITIDDPNLAILLRHRAVMFGLLGGLFATAAFRTAWQPLAFIAAAISVGSFLVLAWTSGPYNNAVQRVVSADIIAALCLLIAVVLYYLRRQQ